MLVDDPPEHRRIASAIPRAFRVHHRDRTSLADAKAVGFRPQDAASLGQPQFFEALFEKIPRRDGALAIAALRIGLIGAEKNVTAGGGDAHRGGEIPEAGQFVGWHMIKSANA